jgi:topoisomerase-4 subunit A
MDEAALVPTEPVTVVLSERGWVRSAKGHDLDPRELPYKAGDAFLQAARGRSNQLAVFLDSTGRAYALPAHALPSARGQGEPLSSHLAPPPGASFAGVILAPEEEVYLLATDAGYGFFVRVADLQGRNRSGKAVINVGGGGKAGKVLLPVRVGEPERDLVAAATDTGRLLLFAASEMPLLPRGKGVKILNIPAGKRGEESLIAVAVLPPGAHLKVHAGRRYLTLKPAEYEHYLGQRAQRGMKLPRGFQNVSALEAVP